MTASKEKNDAKSAASFKLDLIQTVNADPALTHSDLALVTAYVAVMQWPSREAWLSTTLARAKTGLSERQITASRSRLSGKNKAKRSYFRKLRQKGTTTIFRIENPWLEDGRAYVAEIADFYRDQQADKKAAWRAKQKHVPAISAGTDTPLSPSPSDGDVPAVYADNIPRNTYPEKALEGGAANGFAELDTERGGNSTDNSYLKASRGG